MWTLWKRENSVDPLRIQTSDRLLRTLVAIQTTLSRLPYFLHRMFYFPDFFRSLNKIIQTCCFFCTGGGVGITDVGEIMGRLFAGICISLITILV